MGHWKDYFGFWKKQQRTDRHKTIKDPARQRRADLHTIENAGFQWRVTWVAGVGFFADGYTLFSSNYALPMIGYLYWTDDHKSDHETAINSLTLCGCVVGQILLGILADLKGRNRLYGWELVILIVSSLGVATSSGGLIIDGEPSMRIAAWIMFMRFIAGIGIGADYPLTAVITAEYAPTKHRARMMATVFLMQSLGQLSAAVVTIIAIATVQTRFTHPSVAVDSMWRWIYGVGAIFPALALLLRMTIPESPRYAFDVLKNPTQANEDSEKVVANLPSVLFWRRKASAGGGQQQPGHNGQAQQDHNRQIDPVMPRAASTLSIAENVFPPKASVHDFKRYMLDNGNWRRLVGTAGTWFLMDFAFFGLGLNNPQIISTVWNGERPHLEDASSANAPPIWYSDPPTVSWPSNSDNATTAPYADFRNNAIHSLVIVSIGAVLGSLCLIWFVAHISRRRLLILGFLALSILLFIIGGIFSSSAPSYPISHVVVAVFYGVCQFLFNCGPNGLTFIYAGEVFPTRYRCSLYGLSAASGKVGSVIAQGVVYRVKITQRGGLEEPESLGHVLLAFGAVMALGAWVAWAFMPEVQVQGKPSESVELEELAKGREKREDLEMANGGIFRRHSRAGG